MGAARMRHHERAGNPKAKNSKPAPALVVLRFLLLILFEFVLQASHNGLTSG
jgi:hypothetical protein